MGSEWRLYSLHLILKVQGFDLLDLSLSFCSHPRGNPMRNGHENRIVHLSCSSVHENQHISAKNSLGKLHHGTCPAPQMSWWNKLQFPGIVSGPPQTLRKDEPWFWKGEKLFYSEQRVKWKEIFIAFGKDFKWTTFQKECTIKQMLEVEPSSRGITTWRFNFTIGPKRPCQGT